MKWVFAWFITALLPDIEECISVCYCGRDGECFEANGCVCSGGICIETCECASPGLCAARPLGCYCNLEECADVIDVIFPCQCRDTGGCVDDPVGCVCEPGSCPDVDECGLSPTPCGANGDCDNSVGSYTCTCHPGYENEPCEDVDECELSPTPCGANGDCSNEVGSYTCTCDPGYANEPCEDVDECELSPTPCGANGDCSNEVGSYTCTCDPGYANEPCEDVDECGLSPTPCGANGDCDNSVGSYTCTCHPGYENEPCEDVDECGLSPTPCGANGDCDNSVGSYTCTCHPGYENEPCEDVDECGLSPTPCGANGDCDNSVGSYTCTCHPGYENEPCEDVDECGLSPTPCGANGDCDNSVGSYTCTCHPGYENEPCEDIDECSSGNDICNFHGECANLEGSYQCNCYSDFNGTNCEIYQYKQLIDASETILYVLIPSQLPADIQSVIFTWEVIIPNGQYVYLKSRNVLATFCSSPSSTFFINYLNGSETNYCNDSGPTIPRGEIIEANNIVIQLSTEDFSGLIYLDISVFFDVNECTDTNICRKNGECINYIGFYRCVCAENYSGDNCEVYKQSVSVSCEVSAISSTINDDIGNDTELILLSWIITAPSDKKVFLTRTADVSVNCRSSSFMIISRNPFAKYDYCDRNFNEINSESNKVFLKATAKGVDYIPRFTFDLNCDVDECLLSDTCPNENFACINVVGSFICVCKPGYDGENCEAIDMCEKNTCDEQRSNCVNTAQSYICQCKDGFQSHNGMCVEKNWCFSNPCGEDAKCVVSEGSFSCVCDDGFFYNKRKKTCEDVNECSVNDICPTDYVCANNRGSYICQCEEGYQKVLNECVDIDECDIDAYTCPEVNRTKCVNTVGSFKCDCNDGFRLVIDQCQDIDECAERRFACRQANRQKCRNLIGGYDCDCNAGFFLNEDRICEDEDPCGGTSNCKLDQMCENVSGKAVCVCINGREVDEKGECPDICVSNPCQDIEHSFCVNLENQCQCKDKYTGIFDDSGTLIECLDFCSVGVDEHDCVPCSGNGSNNKTCDASPPNKYFAVQLDRSCNEARKIRLRSHSLFVQYPDLPRKESYPPLSRYDNNEVICNAKRTSASNDFEKVNEELNKLITLLPCASGMEPYYEWFKELMILSLDINSYIELCQFS